MGELTKIEVEDDLYASTTSLFDGTLDRSSVECRSLTLSCEGRIPLSREVTASY